MPVKPNVIILCQLSLAFVMSFVMIGMDCLLFGTGRLGGWKSFAIFVFCWFLLFRLFRLNFRFNRNNDESA